MTISCPNNASGAISYLGKDRCKIRRAKFAGFRGVPVIIEKDICRRCGEAEEIKPGVDHGAAKNPQAPAKKAG